MATVFHKLIEVQIVDGKFKTTAWPWSLEDSEPRGISSYLILHSAGAGLKIQLGGTGMNYQFIWRPFFTKKKWIKSSALNYSIITIETKERNLEEGDKGSYWKNKTHWSDVGLVWLKTEKKRNDKEMHHHLHQQLYTVSNHHNQTHAQSVIGP